MPRLLHRLATTTIVLGALALPISPAFAEPFGTRPAGIEGVTVIETAIPGRVISWNMFAWLPGPQVSPIAADYLASTEIVLVRGWGLYNRDLITASSIPPVQARGQIHSAYLRWLNDEIRALPQPRETGSYVGN